MTKKNYIRTLGMIAESMFMQNPSYSWRGSTAFRGFFPTPQEEFDAKDRCMIVQRSFFRLGR